MREILKEYAGADADDETDYAAVGMGRYLDHMSLVHGPRLQDDNIAVIVASGNIVDGSQPPGTVGGESTAAYLSSFYFTDEDLKTLLTTVGVPSVGGG